MTVPFIATGDKIVIHLEGKVKPLKRAIRLTVMLSD